MLHNTKYNKIHQTFICSLHFNLKCRDDWWLSLPSFSRFFFARISTGNVTHVTRKKNEENESSVKCVTLTNLSVFSINAYSFFFFGNITIGCSWESNYVVVWRNNESFLRVWRRASRMCSGSVYGAGVDRSRGNCLCVWLLSTAELTMLLHCTAFRLQLSWCGRDNISVMVLKRFKYK